jgi:hypothetical protein
LLARAFKTCDGMVPALTGPGSKPPAASTVLHSCGSFAIATIVEGVTHYSMLTPLSARSN